MSKNRPYILVVEDSDEDFFIINRLLQNSKMKDSLERCTDGDQALDLLYRRGSYCARENQGKPSIILLDLNMPGTDGREVLRLIKKDPELFSIPVIVFTTSDSEQDMLSCYQDGANCYVQKPVDKESFIEALGKIQKYCHEVTCISS